MKKLNYFLVLLSAYSQLFFSQQKEVRTFREIRSNYEKMIIDDDRAMPFVRAYIQKAKSEGDISHLIQGYRDGRQFDYNSKMKYADSALAASIKYGTKDDISKDYLSKGIIYYFYQKRYKLALNQYMKAYEFSKGSDDQYQYHKVLYHLGVVKAHLGYYDEALEHFRDCSQFYENAMNQKGLHENLQFNNKKAYLNSLHQMTVVNRYLKNVSTSDSLSKLGYKLTEGDQDFLLENSYFLKCMGISKFLKKDYDGSASDLNRALPAILKRNDFAWVSVIYYYLGKISEANNQEDFVIGYYSKIDSIFVKEGFILPEVFRSYNYLISYYKNKDLSKQLYYTDQLLKADSMISKDYPYLSGKLHKEYDRRSLIERKEDIEKIGRKKMRIAQFVILSTTLTIIFFVFRFQKDRKIKKQYDILQKKIKDGSYEIPDIVEERAQEYSLRKIFLTPEVTIEIGEKLKKFERELQFTKKGITQNSIAAKLNTNANYLSIYINENKGMNFTRYIAELRINYITNLLNTNTKYLNYTIEALAEECGIAARQNFSNLFYDINGIRPTEYIKKRKKELSI